MGIRSFIRKAVEFSDKVFDKITPESNNPLYALSPTGASHLVTNKLFGQDFQRHLFNDVVTMGTPGLASMMDYYGVRNRGGSSADAWDYVGKQMVSGAIVVAAVFGAIYGAGAMGAGGGAAEGGAAAGTAGTAGAEGAALGTAAGESAVTGGTVNIGTGAFEAGTLGSAASSGAGIAAPAAGGVAPAAGGVGGGLLGAAKEIGIAALPSLITVGGQMLAAGNEETEGDKLADIQANNRWGGLNAAAAETPRFSPPTRKIRVLTPQEQLAAANANQPYDPKNPAKGLLNNPHPIYKRAGYG